VGRYGPGAAVLEIADTAGVSVGSVHNFTRRCIIALLSLHDQVFHFRDEEQMQGAAQCAANKSGTNAWHGGHLATDGTPIPFFSRPGWYGQDFYGKDKVYAMQLTLVIFIHTLLIADYAVGRPGSTHDASAFQDTRLFKHHDDLLHAYEWIWADSAYTLAAWLITPFKKPRGGELTPEQKRFNYYLSKIHVAVEHAIGLLKLHWSSLKELRIHITDRAQWAYAVMWIRSCLILHNLILRSELAQGRNLAKEQIWSQVMQDFGCSVEDMRSVPSDEADMGDEEEGTPEGKNMRQWLMEQLLAVHPL
ncbi:hypothetical protein DAEQUDRAFT_668173, partial [Daedalea quercina L-15889]